MRPTPDDPHVVRTARRLLAAPDRPDSEVAAMLGELSPRQRREVVGLVLHARQQTTGEAVDENERAPHAPTPHAPTRLARAPLSEPIAAVLTALTHALEPLNMVLGRLNTLAAEIRDRVAAVRWDEETL